MNPTDMNRSTLLTQALFDEVVDPLAEARRAVGAPAYFPLGSEANAVTYFEQPDLTKMRPSDFELHSNDSAEGLVDALAAFWSDRGEAELAAMAPRLIEIAHALINEAAENDGNVDVLCYTLF